MSLSDTCMDQLKNFTSQFTDVNSYFVSQTPIGLRRTARFVTFVHRRKIKSPDRVPRLMQIIKHARMERKLVTQTPTRQIRHTDAIITFVTQTRHTHANKICTPSTVVCYTAVFSVVTQRSFPRRERCVTTLKTAVQQTTSTETNASNTHVRMVTQTRGWGGGDSIYPCGPAPHTLTLFQTKIVNFPTLFKTENSDF